MHIILLYPRNKLRTFPRRHRLVLWWECGSFGHDLPQRSRVVFDVHSNRWSRVPDRAKFAPGNRVPNSFIFGRSAIHEERFISRHLVLQPTNDEENAGGNAEEGIRMQVRVQKMVQLISSVLFYEVELRLRRARNHAESKARRQRVAAVGFKENGERRSAMH